MLTGTPYFALKKLSSFFFEKSKFLIALQVYLRKMEITSDSSTSLDPPPCVRGMKVLDRNAFKKTINVPYFEINSSSTAETLKILRCYLLKLENFKPLQVVETKKHVILNPLKFKDYDVLTEIKKQTLADIGVTEESLKWKKLELNYENWKAESILKSVLPSNLPGVSGYSLIGHILHLNLREHLNEYKELIAQVLLDKIKGVTTVVNKVNIIDSTYRNFKMELLAGENSMKVKVKENGSTFEFDFSEVYWNPRLCTEHARIVEKLKSGDTLYDVFAGVGPFAIPAAKKKCNVLANDLNPHSFQWLCSNSKLNKVGHLLQMYNLDGRDFVRTVVKPHITEQWRECLSKIPRNFHVVMNLPASAVEFLDVFKGLFEDEDANVRDSAVMPVIHCYCFTKEATLTKAAVSMVEQVLECSLTSDSQLEVLHVRSVAPNKEMMRVTFTMPREILFKNNCESNIEPSPKKLRLN
ncbi:tRNA (guanine(37)-N1)-methyltransferase-like [Limulus polyphemus]|uniref:tRNA (guanine(37)-N1)-methyltransferase n=1 Tax=Limulus polyphemus TaxID=6850 RepID=A0ABM1B452_LIMPO|nr:tRNA (guanine(37)-N1)-methyltransferase-like [Limulus polyphemus]